MSFWTRDIWTRIKDVGPRSCAQRERDLEREIQDHLDLETEESGPHRAQRAFGNTMLVKEDVRQAWGWTQVEQFLQDMRQALRRLRMALAAPLVGSRRSRFAQKRKRRRRWRYG